jgi:hypothetical protein
MTDKNPYAPPRASAPSPGKRTALPILGAVFHFASWIFFLYGLWFIVPGMKEALVAAYIYPTRATLPVLWASDLVVRYWWLLLIPAVLGVAASTFLTWLLLRSRGRLRILSRSILFLPLGLLVYSAVVLLGELALGSSALD